MTGDPKPEYQQLRWAGEAFAQGEVVRVEMQTLDTLLADRRFQPGFDLRVVDVEEYEPEVFAGFDLEKWRPKMMIVELTDAHPFVTSNRRRHAELSRSIQSAGYDVLLKDKHRIRSKPMNA